MTINLYSTSQEGLFPTLSNVLDFFLQNVKSPEFCIFVNFHMFLSLTFSPCKNDSNLKARPDQFNLSKHRPDQPFFTAYLRNTIILTSKKLIYFIKNSF